jgi:hypothetical protein
MRRPCLGLILLLAAAFAAGGCSWTGKVREGAQCGVGSQDAAICPSGQSCSAGMCLRTCASSADCERGGWYDGETYTCSESACHLNCGDGGTCPGDGDLVCSPLGECRVSCNTSTFYGKSECPGGACFAWYADGGISRSFCDFLDAAVPDAPPQADAAQADALY